MANPAIREFNRVKVGVFHKQRCLRHLFILVVLSACSGFPGWGQEPAKPVTGPVPETSPKVVEKEPAPAVSSVQAWTEADTRLANHYIRLLEKNPEYGNVLNLLWGIYEKKGQTPLLLEYIGKAATGEQASVIAKTLFAHLLRKNEENDRAREFYSEVLDLDSENVIALRGAAEISDQQQGYAKALSLYTRLVERTPIATEDGVAFRMRQAALLKQSDQLEAAVAIWNELLAAWPGNTALRTEIVSLLMEAGRTEDAIAVLEGLTGSDDPELRLTSLESLSRLYQFISEFDGSKESLEKALALLHFKHQQFEMLFTRLVRLHERFGKLDDIQDRLEVEASRDNPSEKSVFLMAEFHRLTANPALQEKWMARLAELVPGNTDYQVELAGIQMENDRYAEAAVTLDRLIAAQQEVPLRLVLLRVRVALNLDGREEAETLLRRYLDEENPSTDVVEKVLAFSQEHYLDGLVEHLLRGPMAEEIAGGDRESAPVELARFLRERGRTRQAVESLRDFVDEAGEAAQARAARLGEVSAAFRDLDLVKQATAAIDEAIALDPEKLAYQISKAEIQIDRRDSEGALVTLEAVWKQSPGLEAKTEIDQRIFSLLRGMTDEEPPEGASAPMSPFSGGNISTLAQYRRLAAAATMNNGREADEAPPKRLMEFYGGIKEAAYDQPSLETRYRAAWWSFKLQDFQETYTHLTAAQAEAGKPVVELEKMLFDLAEQNERLPFMARHLETLAEIDPENAREYLQRRAEVRFLLGYEDEAIRSLEELAADPDATLNTLKTLASVYQRQGRAQSQIRVWQDAYRRANLFEKRRIIKQLATTFIELDQPNEALKAQMDLISRETDLVQKRKQFDAQLSVASRHFLGDWLRDRYTELAQQNPFERFYPEALARIHRAAGRYDDAFMAMKRAYYMSGQDRELLTELGELAGRTKDLKSAIYYNRQLIAQAEDGADAESWRSLIDMLERDLRVPESDRMRRRLESKFAQDADFLKQLVRQYSDSGRPAETERVLDQLTSLRPWDAAAWLELGLITLEHGGDSKKALAAFEKVIEETAESALPADEAELSHYPIIAGGWFSGQGTRPETGGLATFAEGVRNHFPSIEAELQVTLVDWLNEPRAEFFRVPHKPEALRLRAIEEAARIHGHEDASRQAWAERWSDKAAQSPTERLWALHYAGENKGAFEILQEHLMPPKTAEEKLAFAVLSLRMGQEEALLDWAKNSRGVRDGTEGDRRLFPLLATSLLIQEMTSSGKMAISDDTIKHLLTELPESYLTGSHFLNRIRVAHPEKALMIGNVLSEGPLRKSGDFLYSVAEVADELADEDEHRRWLERSLEVMEPNDNTDLHDPGLPIRYFAAVTKYFAILESAAEREEFLRKQADRIASNPKAPDWVKAENRALLALVSRDSGAALSEIRNLMTDLHFLVQPSTRAFTFQFERIAKPEPWAMRERVLMQFAPRQFAGMDPLAFFEATGNLAGPPPLTGDLDNREQYEQFEIARLIWLLESLSPPERAFRVREIISLLHHPDSRAELASLLEARGFHREAIPVYHQLLQDKPDDISPLRGFFGACRKAQDYEPALELIQKYLDREVQTPNGLTADYLSQNHAEFLFMARDIETLKARAQDPSPPRSGGPNRSLLIPENQNPWRYHNALVRAHERRGQPEALLRLLEHLRDRGQAMDSDRLLAAKHLRARDEPEAAIEWLRGIQLDQQQAVVEIAAIRELASLFESAEPVARERLVDLARSALDYRDVELNLELAGKLYAAGARTEGRSCLLLSARRTDVDPADRTRLLAGLVRFELENGATFEEISGELRNLADGLQRSDHKGLRAIAGLVEEFGTGEKEAWLEFLNSIQARRENRLLAAIGTAALQGNLSAEAAKDQLFELVRNSDDEFGRAVVALTEFGEPGESAAKSLLDRRTRPSVVLLGGDPVHLVKLFGQLNDRDRAARLHARLLRETESDLFYQLRNTNRGGNLVNRAAVPRTFEEAGFPEMAGALYRRYHEDLPRLTHEHTVFLEDYVRYLIGKKEFGAAELALVPALQKSIGMNPELLVDLYRAWERLDEYPEIVDKHYLSSGVRVELKDIWTARSIGR